ncbi:MAG: beta-galactosidase [Acidimicrobiales bacterium]
MVLTSAELDGVSPTADWSYWISTGRAPAGFDHGIDVQRWTDDLEQVASLGANEVVLTVEWARLEPEPGRHDPVATMLTRDVIVAARDRGLTVWLCLLDGTAPGWFTYDEHGFADGHARRLLWPRHVEWVGETFGDLADGWVPMREPAHLGVRARLIDKAPPGGTNPVKAAEAVRDLALAVAEAWRILRGSAPVATYQTARVFVPERSAEHGTTNVKASREVGHLDDLFLRPWLQAIVDGTVQAGNLPGRPVADLADAFDQVFVQLRPPIVVDGDGGWHLHPQANVIDRLAEGLSRVADHVGDRPLCAVADLAPAPTSEPSRADYLGELMAAAADVGVDGWFQSSPIDGWHWEAGEHLEPGIVARDRSERPSAGVFGSA